MFWPEGHRVGRRDQEGPGDAGAQAPHPPAPPDRRGHLGQFRPGTNTVVAVDSLGVGEGETVLFCQGSSARLADGMKAVPIDAAVVGIVDAVTVRGKSVYKSST